MIYTVPQLHCHRVSTQSQLINIIIRFNIHCNLHEQYTFKVITTIVLDTDKCMYEGRNPIVSV
jgi:hypothetical protein